MRPCSDVRPHLIAVAVVVLMVLAAAVRASAPPASGGHGPGRAGPAASVAAESPAHPDATVSPDVPVVTPPAGNAQPPLVRPGAHTVTYDRYSVKLDGKRLYLWSAEFHYWRLPSPDLWRDVLQKVKAAGYNATSIYFDWAYHSPKAGVYDFSGVRDIDRLLTIADQVGIYVIARPGPYISAGTDSGGFPGWLVTQKGRARSSAPDYTKAYEDWLRHVDPIIARHQVTDGSGSVLLYQVENEYGSGTEAAYMANVEKRVRADGVRVPLTHNHCCGASTWATGPGAVDLPGQDSYPQGFDCSNPTQWNGVDALPRLREDAPIFTPEYQGGAFDPWGGPGYEKCRTLTGPDFEKVFSTNNIADGATAQNFYMTYGGTSWGWLADPRQVYTSYDYGAAIKEDRELTSKYDEAKRIGYFTQSVAPLAKTDQVVQAPPTNPALQLAVRANPDDNTHVYVLRHRDATSTSTETTHIPIDLNAKVAHYTYDDNDTRLGYAGEGWSHVAHQSYTSGDYGDDESFSDQVGDSVTIPFTGTAIRWISSGDANHGIADVYLDDKLVAKVDGYAAVKSFQDVFYKADGLTNGSHTLKIVATGTKNAAASGAFVVVDAIDLSAGPPAGDATYPSVPQEPGTSIKVAGRDAKLLVAGYRMGGQDLRYSTSELMTHARIGARDVALFHGRQGEDGETVLHYDSPPAVTVLAGKVRWTWDGSRGDLRLNYTHDGLARVLVTPRAGTPLLLLIGTDEEAARFWRQDTSAGPVFVRGPELVRSAAVHGNALDLTGDTSAPTDLEVFAPPSVRVVRWNGVPTTGRLPGPRTVSIPALTDWRSRRGAPEAQPGFDDRSWRVADKTSTNNPTPPATLPVLYADDYGFHHGDVWYRGHFLATGDESGVNLTAITGRAGVYTAWLNGHFLGSTDDHAYSFAFPAADLRPGKDNVLSVLLENMGHNEDRDATDTHKEPRGLTSAAITGVTTPLAWRIQGSRGGEDLADPVRGPFNTGGLYGERKGWHLPGVADAGWTPVKLPHRDPTPGVTWYRTTFDLKLPPGQDVPLGVRFADDPSRHYRALLFVNGWQLGRYVNDVGPQHDFPVPPGILRTDGHNTIAIAVWNEDATTGGLGRVTLQPYANLATGLRVRDVPSPG